MRSSVRASCITTGGLGPTEDDITRKVVARALGKRLTLDEKVLEEIRDDDFKRFGMNMPERNSRQAMVIAGAEVLSNPNGSAPGLYLSLRQSRALSRRRLAAGPAARDEADVRESRAAAALTSSPATRALRRA